MRGENRQAPRCSSHASGPFPSISANRSPFGCRPSKIASTMSGARQAGERQEPADIRDCHALLLRQVGGRLRAAALDLPAPALLPAVSTSRPAPVRCPARATFTRCASWLEVKRRLGSDFRAIARIIHARRRSRMTRLSQARFGSHECFLENRRRKQRKRYASDRAYRQIAIERSSATYHGKANGHATGHANRHACNGNGHAPELTPADPALIPSSSPPRSPPMRRVRPVF
jgi:hypothetical protein